MTGGHRLFVVGLPDFLVMVTHLEANSDEKEN
jgi:hypothetical protein